jgi:RNA polymerase sigma-70 factor (ECF subfamily)
LQNDCLYNEQEILARVAEDDERAFALLVQEYTATIYTHVLTYLKNAARAEEITQDIFMNVWKHRKELPSILNFPGYLYVMTRNRTHSAFREKIFNPDELGKDELENASLNPATILEFRQLSETLREGINLLPPRRKEVFTMSRFDKLSYDQIAAQLGVSKSAVNKHIIEALVFLRTHLRNQAGPLILIVFSACESLFF